MMSDKEKEQAIAKDKREREQAEAQAYLDIVVAGSPPPGVGRVDPPAPGGDPAACAPLGLLGLSPVLVSKVLKWKP